MEGSTMVNEFLKLLAASSGQYEFDEIGLQLLAEQWCFERLEVLGEGGMSTILLGVDDGVRIALKILGKEVSTTETAVVSFRREAGILKYLAGAVSPTLLQDYSICPQTGYHVFGMEEITGCCLNTHLRRKGAFSVTETRDIGMKATLALAHLEQKGIVHRDIKASNIVLDEFDQEGRIVLVDFGLACKLKVAQKNTNVVGTVAFAAPEHLEGRPGDHRSDIYSLGLTLWHLLTDELPFGIEDVDTIEGTSEKVFVCRKNNQLTQLSIPDGLFSVICKASAENPDDRYQCAAELRIALEELSV